MLCCLSVCTWSSGLGVWDFEAPFDRDLGVLRDRVDVGRGEVAVVNHWFLLIVVPLAHLNFSVYPNKTNASQYVRRKKGKRVMENAMIIYFNN